MNDEYTLHCRNCFCSSLVDPEDLAILRKHSIACPYCDSPNTEVFLRDS